MEQGIAARKAEAESNASTQGESPDYPGQQVIWRLIQEAGESLRDELRTLAFTLHDHPEEAFEEVFATEEITKLLQNHGFEVQSGVYGVKTALETSFETLVMIQRSTQALRSWRNTMPFQRSAMRAGTISSQQLVLAHF